MVKATFTFDEDTFKMLKRTAARLRQPQSQIVREAVKQYAHRNERISEVEIIRKLRILEEYLARPAEKTDEEVDRELRDIREARRGYGRRHPVD